MHYLFMLFLIGGEGSPIDAYKVYEQRTFDSMDQCVEFFEENKDQFNEAARLSSNGRNWLLACADQTFKDNLESLRKPTNSLNPNVIFS